MTHRRNRGSRRRVPVHRRMAIDIARLGNSIPSFPVHRTMNLGLVDSARRASPTRVGWTAMLVHAYGQVSREMPELCDLYVANPLPYLYRHPEPVGSITVSRLDANDNERLIWGRISLPAEASLVSVQEQISHFQTGPIESIFGDGIDLERKPEWIRRYFWWVLMRWSGRNRAKKVGTFSVSSLGGHGALNAHHPLVTTSSISMGPIASNGDCEVVMLCDHRVLDGMLAARALARLEQILMNEVARSLSGH